MKNNIARIFIDLKQLQIFILGIYSGVPLYIIYVTLSAWMKKFGVDIAIITSFATARIFYSLKFFWAPFVDHLRLPFLYRLGRRKSWIILLMITIAAIIFAYSLCDPLQSIQIIFILTLCLGFASATLDIAIDAYRIDTIDQEYLAAAAANAVFGYRLGGLLAVTGGFYIADEYEWSYVFIIISAFYIAGCFFTLSLKEKKIATVNIFEANTKSQIKCNKAQGATPIYNRRATSNDVRLKNGAWYSIFKPTILEPFVEFFQRQHSLIILSAVIFYKLGDAMLGVVATPFYIELGFTLKQIGTIVKLYGFAATILGSYIGGMLMYKYGNIKGMFICGIMQSVTNLAFVWLHHQGSDVNSLIIAISIENIASGMGDAALIGYLSYLCNKNFSATQYALLSSGSGLFSHSIVVFGGSIVKIIGWDYYFYMTSILAIPGLLLLIFLGKKQTKL